MAATWGAAKPLTNRTHSVGRRCRSEHGVHLRESVSWNIGMDRGKTQASLHPGSWHSKETSVWLKNVYFLSTKPKIKKALQLFLISLTCKIGTLLLCSFENQQKGTGFPLVLEVLKDMEQWKIRRDWDYPDRMKLVFMGVSKGSDIYSLLAAEKGKHNLLCPLNGVFPCLWCLSCLLRWTQIPLPHSMDAPLFSLTL